MIRSILDEIENPSPRAIRVAIADVRRLIAEALKTLIAEMPGFIVTDAVSWDDADAVAAARKADLVLVGVGGKPDGAIDFVRVLRTLAKEQEVEQEVVILADRPEPDLLRFVLDERLNGLLITEAQVQDFEASLNQVARGHAVLPAAWQDMLADEPVDPLRALSERQMEVLELLAEGRSYEEISTQLFISVNTVKFHTRSIFSLLGVRNRVEAARLLAPRLRPTPRTPDSAI